MRRQHLLLIARVGFLALAIGFAVWGLRDQQTEIRAALAATSVAGVVAAVVLVVLGLLGTSYVWRVVLASYGHRPPARPATAIFFVGQLGKYIPGSIWSLGAQAQMATRFRVPARVTVATGLIFLGYNVATSVVLGFSVGIWSLPDVAPAFLWIGGIATIASVVFLWPRTTDQVGTWLAGAQHPLQIRPSTALRCISLMVGIWVLYGVAARLLIPAVTPLEVTIGTLTWTIAAFCLSYAAGVLVVIAPAGLGAREFLLAWLLTPAIGLPAAATVAILTRLVHTVADFGLAATSWGIQRLAAPDPESASTQVRDPGRE